MKRLLVMLCLLQSVGLFALDEESEFCRNFLDFYFASEVEGERSWIGFTYTHVNDRYGPFFSVGQDLEGTFSYVHGIALRLVDEPFMNVDFQFYCGAGFFGKQPGMSAGLRAGMADGRSVSRWDVGLGVQVYGKQVVPTVSVGLSIWGIPTLIAITAICVDLL